MTPAQRRQHYDAWRVCGMSRTAYARQHGINNKTFWHHCRAFSADDARGPAPADNRPAILPVTLSVSDTPTLKLQCACVTASPAGIAAIIRELNLC